MNDIPWYVTFFGDDYLRLYSPFLPPQKTAREVQDILALLNLPTGSSILDLCCGYGRHAVPLALQGYKVTGLDLSMIFLQQAQATASEQHVELRWIHSDMRTIPFENEFDAVINIFTSFGYLSNESEDQIVLQQVHKALKPGGKFLLETVHQARVVRATSPHSITRYSDNLVALEERHIDLLTSRSEVRVSLLYPQGKRSEHRQSMRIYTLTELVHMLERAGLEVLAYYGGLEGGTLTLDSRLVLLAQK